MGASTASTKSWKEAEESRTGIEACMMLRKELLKSCSRCFDRAGAEFLLCST